ncbi:MAG: GNAT family N-acetyltransferase [bacterium]|nr:GNAT family N-acetyltransferase [bacterium]MCP5069093.1 GNAT family N-acetyltransferase [bacterium]
MLARAFRDNPLNRAVIGERPERRLRCNQLGMAVHLPVAHRHGEVRAAWRERRLVGVLVSVPSFGWPLPAPAFGARLRVAFRQGLGVASRWAEVSDALTAHHPLGAHAYLATLGVSPAAQGQGIGRALLAAWLGEVDAANQWAWLETDREQCLPLYESAGFQIQGEMGLHGVPVYLMERKPAAEAGCAET